MLTGLRLVREVNDMRFMLATVDAPPGVREFWGSELERMEAELAAFDKAHGFNGTDPNPRYDRVMQPGEQQGPTGYSAGRKLHYCDDCGRTLRVDGRCSFCEAEATP